MQKLGKLGLLQDAPPFVMGGTHYETIMGSEAYGVSHGSSDKDIYGFAIPPKEYIFPHLIGKIHGFSSNIQGFEQYQKAHITHPSLKYEYDLSIFSIIKYFKLCMDNNPNMLDSLFTSDANVQHITPIGRMVRDNRKLFVSKKCWYSFRGYAHKQIVNLEIKNPQPGTKRFELKEKYGMDTKYAYHAIRLLNEARQLLETGSMNLTQGNEVLKAIRAGEYSIEQIRLWCAKEEETLETLYAKTILPHTADEAKITQLLLNCLEQHFGCIDKMVRVPDIYEKTLIEVRDMLNKVTGLNTPMIQTVEESDAPDCK